MPRFAVLLVTALLLAGCGAGSGPGPTQGFGRLAGYVWTGQVSSVEGAWVAPLIAAGSPPGHGSTWIGAQVAGPSDHAPFIQVGITEDRAPSAGGGIGSTERAFWSATSLGFHPHFLWPVRAGDEIRATLVLLPSRWRVQIADVSDGRRSQFTTPLDAGGSFAVAEWLQEDPTRSDGSRLPYPRLGPVRFTACSVNGRPPRYKDVASQWMSLQGRDLAPSPLAAASFSIAPARLSAPGRRYLALVARVDRAIASFDATAARWRARTPLREIVATSARLATALHVFGSALRARQWPPGAEGAVAGLVGDLQSEAGILQAAAAAGPSPMAWTERYGSAALTTAAQSRVVRRRLGVPELDTIT